MVNVGKHSLISFLMEQSDRLQKYDSDNNMYLLARIRVAIGLP